MNIELKRVEQGLENKLEQIDEKLEKIELRSKMLENKVRALGSSEQSATRNLPPTKAVTELRRNHVNINVEKHREDRRSENRSQEHQQARTTMTKTSMPN